MRWWATVFVPILLAGQVLAATQAVYFVDPDLGSDGHPGALAAPFQTIEKARDTVRLMSAGMSGDIVVYLRGGIYPLSEALTLDARDSGQNGFRVVYRNYPHEEPILDGGKRIRGWAAVGGGVYAASAEGMVFNQLFVNNRPAQRARHPEPGAPYRVIDNDDPREVIRINKGEIESWAVPGPELNRVQIVLATSYTSCRVRIGSYEVQGDQAWVSLMYPDHAAFWGLAPGPREGSPSYYFENHFAFLDTPGEWFLDADTDTVYYMPRADEHMASADVVAPQTEALLHVDGASDVTLFGLTFQHAAWLEPMTSGMVQRQGGVLVRASYDDETGAWSRYLWNTGHVALHCEQMENVRIERCAFLKMGASVLGFGAGTRDNTVVGNVFADIADSGIIYNTDQDILDASTYTPGPDQSTRDTFDSNYFFNLGTRFYGGMGLMAFWPNLITITHNEFSHINGLGMNIGFYPGADSTGILVAPVVTHNRVHDTALRARDSGGIHTKADQHGGLYSENWIYNVYPRTWWATGPMPRPAHGVYLDDNTEGVTVSSTVFLNIRDDNVFDKTGLNTLSGNGGQNQAVKDASGLRPAYADIKQFWRGGAIGRNLEPGATGGGTVLELGPVVEDTFDNDALGSPPPGYTTVTGGGTVEVVTAIKDVIGDTVDSIILDGGGGDQGSSFGNPEIASPFLNASRENTTWMRVGRTADGDGRNVNAVFVFRLPQLSDGDTFESARLNFYLEDYGGGNYPVDLYGLDARESSDLQADDFYFGASEDPTANATLLQASLLTAATPIGAVQSANIAPWLTAQYDGGGNAGKYVFLRLSPRPADSGIYNVLNGYVVASADYAGKKPRLTYTDGGNRYLRLADKNASAELGVSLRRDFAPQDGVVACEFRVRPAQTRNNLFFSFRDASDKSACQVGFSGAGGLRFVYQDGVVVDFGAYSADTWLTFRIEADVRKQAFSLWVDGKLVVGDTLFLEPTGPITRMQLSNNYQWGHFDVDWITIESEQAVPRSATPGGTPYAWIDQHYDTEGWDAGDYAWADSSDGDQDGHSTGEEYLAGTGPGDTASVLSVIPRSSWSGGESFTWKTVRGRTYTVQCSTNLAAGAWSDVPDPAYVARPGHGGSVTFSAPFADGCVYYRILVDR